MNNLHLRKNSHRWVLLVSLVLMVLGFGRSIDGASAAQTTERAALVALYNSTNGDSWDNHENWLSDTVHHCDWYGVSCNAEQMVDRLLLGSNQLNGTIPPEIGDLKNLWVFYLPDNQLSGAIPPELGSLPELRKIHLDFNEFSGSIPPELGNLSNLVHLDLGGSNLSGPIPRWLGNLSNLEVLILWGNPLGGFIPMELGNLRNLRWLALYENDLSGPIPGELADLSQMEYLNLLDNQLTCWESQDTLDWANDVLDGKWDTPNPGNTVCSAQDIERAVLVAYYNSTNGAFWKRADGWLDENVNHCDWYGVDCDSAGHVSSLSSFDNQLSGYIPPELSKLSKLTELHLEANQLHGPIPPELANLSYLRVFSVSSNQLGGPIPPEFANLSNLTALNMNDNQLSGPIPPELGNLSKLRWLSLGGNQLSGSIPPELGNLSKLWRIILGNNQLSGPIPPELGNFGDQFFSLHLNDNQLSGPIPEDLSDLKRLRRFFLTNNQLTCWESPRVLNWAKSLEEGLWDYPDPGDRVCGELVRNGDFEDGKAEWRFYSNGEGRWQVRGGDAYSGERAAHVVLDKEGSNVQLYQPYIMLEPNQSYRLSFAARSSSGQDMGVYLHKHHAYYKNYGLRKTVDLDTTWKTFSLDFTTMGFEKTVYDARLRFWFAPFDSDNSSYDIDDVVLEKIASGDPPADPDPEDPIIPSPGPCTPVPNNALANPGFEDGKQQWHLFSNGSAKYKTIAKDAYQCGRMAEVTVADPGSNTQLYQSGVSLQPQTRYRLQFYGRAVDSPQKIKLFVHKHDQPYTNYGLNGVAVTLPVEGAVFAIEFTTTNFTTAIDDARLRIWLARLPGAANLYLDDFVLIPLDDLASANQGTADGPMTVNLVSGYFIDDDDDDRFAGAKVHHELYLPLVQIQR